jgi:D-3-phosphoglycerate dehydrogenase / 2-oxoglutarate reductase
MAKYKILMTDCIFPDQTIERDGLAAIDAELVLAPSADEATLAALAADADGILVTYAEVTAKVIAAAARCRIIARTGIGVNNIDIGAATAQGIMVANVPDYCIAEVADHTLALMLTCLRKTAYLSAAVKHGSWNMNLARPIPRLNRLTAGLFGLGNIAQAVVGRLQAFGLKVLAYDPYVADAVFSRLGVERARSLAELAAAADVLSLHAPLTKETRGIINGAIFRLMKRSAILINTSRGPLVDETDLREAIESGLIAGCGLDVMATEPGDLHSPLLQQENVIVTPHVAFYSEGSDIELREKSTRQIILALTEGQPKYWLNRTM